MPPRILDGKLLAQTIRREIAAKVKEHTDGGAPPPGLTAILVGENPASRVYVRNKKKAAEEVGIHAELVELSAEISQRDLLEKIAELNSHPAVHGILVQLPLPKHIDESAVIHAVDPEIDVDCFHPENVGMLVAGHPRFYPCTPHGCLQILMRNGIETAGKEVVIVGRSNIVGKPLAMMLAQKKTGVNPAGGDATVTIAHTRTANLAEVCRRADILVAAVGVPRLITPEMVKPGAVILDVGINSVEGKLVGDVHESALELASAYTPVPGGIGPMTIAMLLENTLQAAITLDG